MYSKCVYIYVYIYVYINAHIGLSTGSDRNIKQYIDALTSSDTVNINGFLKCSNIHFQRV